jgi:predicted metal-binding protein
MDIMGSCIACDKCGAETTKHLSPELVRMDEKNKGWKFKINGKDYCPKCASKLK